MDEPMSPEAAAVQASFVAAYEPFLDAALAEREIALPNGWSAAVDRGRAWLQATLTQVLAQPLEVQRRSPLEVFLVSLRFPTETLSAAGIAPAARDDVETRALPGDLFGLAPASSRDLGEQAWQAHLAWGVAKAKAVGRAVPRPAAPTSGVRAATVALLGTDLMDRSRIESVVTASGLSLEVWRNPAAIEAGLEGALPALALVDLNHSAADAAIRSTTAVGVRCIVFGPHVDDIALVRAQSLGATDVLPRSRFFKRLPDLLPRQA